MSYEIGKSTKAYETSVKNIRRELDRLSSELLKVETKLNTPDFKAHWGYVGDVNHIEATIAMLKIHPSE
jgi:hypothetical protein